jgi:hypothetical protein
MTGLLEAAVTGNAVLADEIVNGTIKPDGTRRNDGFNQVVPLWARGTGARDELQGIVVVDESQQTVTVTVHWERVPTKLRAEAASLASTLVDSYYGVPKGGRPRKAKPTPETR